MAGVRADYDRVLRQRNTLLKSLVGRPRMWDDAATTLDVWDSHLAAAGAELLDARLATLDALMPQVAKAYADIAPTNNEAIADYKTSLDLAAGASRTDLTELLAAKLTERRTDELQRGLTLAGPHRDDVALSLGTLPVRGYASHGESWSYALALRLGAFQLLRADGVEPVLVLDDVFAELDTTRRDRLAGSVVGRRAGAGDRGRRRRRTRAATGPALRGGRRPGQRRRVMPDQSGAGAGKRPEEPLHDPALHDPALHDPAPHDPARMIRPRTIRPRTIRPG